MTPSDRELLIRHGVDVAAELRKRAAPVTSYPKGKSREEMTPAERMIFAAEIHEQGIASLKIHG